ncbi:hypothetical protein [Rhodanobacter sp. DHG33]|uniref:hypothetical protein n=1 Tax=Rhodanobacter sp. DHG33 TaxID=2775921 RepID=UPI00177CD3BE|nr:hypothetical protein [Rhodanobacter sp. DHG33]MBD8899328.1 hypothetical protein [Rhodanobacter sp. DHG33]
MHIRLFAALPLCLFAFAVSAQTTTASDQWAPVAPATHYASQDNQAARGNEAAATPSPFKFKEPRKTWEPEPPPPRANDQQTVMGTQHAWMDGQPPVVCAQTPRDPSCH